MQIVIDQSDFRRLSPEIQVALIEALGGDKIPKDAGKGSRKANSDPGLHWRRPADLQPRIDRLRALRQDAREKTQEEASEGG